MIIFEISNLIGSCITVQFSLIIWFIILTTILTIILIAIIVWVTLVLVTNILVGLSMIVSVSILLSMILYIKLKDALRKFIIELLPVWLQIAVVDEVVHHVFRVAHFYFIDYTFQEDSKLDFNYQNLNQIQLNI